MRATSAKNTLVVFTPDQGLAFGQHGFPRRETGGLRFQYSLTSYVLDAGKDACQPSRHSGNHLEVRWYHPALGDSRSRSFPIDQITESILTPHNDDGGLRARNSVQTSCRT